MLNLKIKKLNDLAKLPTQATAGSAGWDLYATEEKLVVDGPITYVEYKTGLAFEILPGYVGLLFARSSISSNTTLILANAVGILDSDYRNEVTFRFKSMAMGASKRYKIGDKIGQIIILPYPQIKFELSEELNDPKTRSGGYGSSGN